MKLQTSHVFGISSKINTYSYYDRKGLDKKLRRLLNGNVHIAIKGPSKCGKSWLRQKCLDNAIIVQCRIGMDVETIYKQALSKINVSFDKRCSEETNVATSISGGGDLKFPIVGAIKGDASRTVKYNHSSGVDMDFSTSIQNLEFVADSIKNSGKRLVIEDFHYLDQTTREQLAFDLKSFWDYGCNVIIIGVWTQTNLLTAMNPDLTGRIKEISVSWENEELAQVIKRGCEALNIEIDPNITKEMICDSFGNVGILQSLLLEMIEEQADIEECQDTLTPITDSSLYKEAAKAYAAQLDGRYQNFAKTLSAGIRKRKGSTGIYALAMEAIVNASDDKLMHGFSRSDIFNIIHAKEKRIQKGNLKTVLRKLNELQDPKGEKEFVITYDETIDAILAIDRQLLFYRKHHTMKWPWEEIAEEARQQSLFESEADI